MNILSPANGAERLSLPEYLDLCKRHFRRYWKHYCIPLAVVFLLQTVIRIDVNYTDSLPDHVFVTVKGWRTGLQRGDYVAYAFPAENPVSPFRKGDHMVKIVAGLAGDRVEVSPDRSVTIYPADQSDASRSLGGHNVGVVKTVSRSGKPLEAFKGGLIPEGAYYVFAPHKDSLDSRYGMVGLIRGDEHVIGRTFPIF